MTTTNRSKILRSAAGLFALAVVLLNPIQSHAQTTQTLVNYYTGAALTISSSPMDGMPLVSSVFMPLSVPPAQRWAFEIDPNGTQNNVKIWTISSTVGSLKVADVSSHFTWDTITPVVQATKLERKGDGITFDCNRVGCISTPWKFQRWTQISTPFVSGVVHYFLFQNFATKSCMTDLGSPAIGGAVIQTPCDYSPRQLWAVLNNSTGRFD